MADLAVFNEAARLEQVDELTYIVLADAAQIRQLSYGDVPVRHVIEHAPIGNSVVRGPQLGPRSEAVFFHGSNDGL